MKTSELTGAALDWVVSAIVENRRKFPIWIDGKPQSYAAYSTDWAYGGPIIEREEIGLWAYSLDEDGNPSFGWYAELPSGGGLRDGETPLIAAMRCYVASKLGDDVELPKELE